MSERLSEPDRPELTPAQDSALRNICGRYGVEYAREHYFVYPPDSVMMAGWAEGWVGGRRHANPQYAAPEQPAGKPTIYVGVSPEGEVHS
jgi:hypothetical protein